MGKYRFRLETLAKVRQRARDAERQRLADAYRADEVLAQQRADVALQLEELAGVRRAALSADYVDINRLAAAGRYEPVLHSHQRTIEEQQRLLDEEIERRRQALVEADRGVRALELLDERHRAEHERQEQRLETRELDEVASQQWLARQ